MRLSTFAAAPRQVTIGGVAYVAPRLRLRDVASLEAWFESVAIEANPGVAPEEIEGWPPTLGSEIGGRLLGTPDGLAMLLLLTIGRGGELSDDGALALAVAMTRAEEAAFVRAIFPEPREGGSDPDRPRRPMDWHGAILDLIKVHHYTPDDSLDMAMDQFFGMFESPSRGRPPRNWKIPIRDPEHMARLWREHEAKLKAEAETGEPAP